jgi:hypothetical protein
MSRVSHGVTRVMAELPQTPIAQCSSALAIEPDTHTRAQPVEIIRNPSRDLAPLAPPEAPQNSKGMAGDERAMMWRVCDPLEDVRQGEYVDQLAGLEYLAKDIQLGEVSKSPTSLETLATVEESRHVEVDHQPLPPLLVASRTPLKTNKAQNQSRFTRNLYIGEPTASSAYAYLKARAEDLDDDETSASIHQQLAEIWETCGFSTSQKLAMVLKYTKSTEDSAAITQALVAWKNALEIVQIYQQKYLLTKEYLRHGAGRQPQFTRSLLLSEYEKELTAAEEAMTKAAASLKAIGDELIFKRKKAAEVIEIRRKKLWRLKIESSLDGGV